jgi:aspartyl-tRNA(Asn)/glutamyl-tRNA(Gln) amidotransferase subunit B
MAPSAAWLDEVRQRVVELPLARKQRFMTQYHLPAPDAETFVQDTPLGDYFETVAPLGGNPKMIANWIINNLRARMAESQITLPDLKFPPAAIPALTGLLESGKISSKIAQDVFNEMFDTGQDPNAIVERKGLVQLSDTGAIEKLCDDAIAAQPRSVADFKAGKANALNFLKGQVMKMSQGKANPAIVGDILARKLQSCPPPP